ncbi:1-acyl-sn-glycerol-3-phosphate acyltransferase [Anaeromyxobacter oryzisoli]|uniref:1-acyl-sn-glycerol-3-phosphate acyltransferase n=1 Tax=Anaeromyxobacter oryzisoli TaxID=2925408 RepID=UPI001F55C673|nr:1-acyl-sn-glycerol-3-phosphate acyltransferase [Anaeromyxobacter sp. SG63]
MLLKLRRADASVPPRIDHALLERSVEPLMRTLLRVGYFGLEVEGTEWLPRDGRAVYAMNHAGWFPLDAFFTGLTVSNALGPGKAPFFAAHDSALAAPLLGPFLRRLGAVPVSWMKRPERLPPEIRACGIFPEGVEGNCKPFWRAYRQRPWKRGFVRVAAALDAPIVPVAVLGGEESLPVAWTVRCLEPVIGSIFGLPLSLVPLPARWKIVFHRPVRVRSPRSVLRDPDAQAALAARVRATVQATLDRNAAGKPLARLSALVEAARLGHAPAPAAPPAVRSAPKGRRRSARRAAGGQKTERSSISKTSVALGGMSGGAPRAP